MSEALKNEVDISLQTTEIGSSVTLNDRGAVQAKKLCPESSFALQRMESYTNTYRRSKRRKRKMKGHNTSGEHIQEKLPDPLLQAVQNCSSDKNSSLLVNEKIDSPRQKNNSTTISSYSTTSIEKENNGLTIVATSNSTNESYMSPEIKPKPLEVKHTYSKQCNKAKKKGNSVVKEHVPFPSLQVIASSQAIDSGTCGNRSSIPEVAETGSLKKNNNSSTFISGNLIPQNEKEASGFQKSAFADSAKSSDIFPMMNPDIHEMKIFNPEKRKKCKNKRKNNNETLVTSSMMSTGKKEESGLTKAEHIDSLEGTGLYPEISSNLEKMNNACLKQYKRDKERGKCKFSDHFVKTVKQDILSMPLQNVPGDSPSTSLSESLEMDLVKKSIDIDAFINKGVLLKSSSADLPRKGAISPEIDISNRVENASTSQTVKTKKEKNKNNDCSDYDVESVKQDVQINSLQVVQNGKKNSSGRASTSDKYERTTKKKKMKHTEHEEIISSDASIIKSTGLLDESQQVSPSCVVLWDENVKKPSNNNKKESLPPSLIRGVIDDAALSNLANNQGNPSITCKEGVSFSFQVVGNASIDKSSENHSENENARGRDGVNKMIPINDMHITLNNTFPCDIFPKLLEQNNEDLSELQKCDVFTNEEKKVPTELRDEGGDPSSSNNNVTVDATLDKISKQEKIVIEVPMSPQRPLISCTRKKLLVLDLNGLLVDVIYENQYTRRAPIKVGGKSVFRRPFCDEFLKFCFEMFDIGVWSSRRKDNVNVVVNFLMGDMKHKLLFCWDQSKCTITGFNTIENVHKPLVLKELKKIWDKDGPGLPWQKGEYSASNTLLIDDSPYKALCNPPHTAIFPRPYHFKDEDDNSLGSGGDIRVYLQGLAMVDDVPKYVKENPFGQCAITPENPSWKFYLKIIDKISQASSTPTG